MDVVLVHLSQYFNLHLYSTLQPPQHDSESTTVDIDDIGKYSHYIEVLNSIKFTTLSMHACVIIFAF